MSDLLIRNIPEALKADLQNLAEKRRQSLSQTAQEALRAGVDVVARQQSASEDLPLGDRLCRLFSDLTADEAEEFQKAMEEVEEMRRRDFGRPVPDFE
jgi:antitoxin FitA